MFFSPEVYVRECRQIPSTIFVFLSWKIWTKISGPVFVDFARAKNFSFWKEEINITIGRETEGLNDCHGEEFVKWFRDVCHTQTRFCLLTVRLARTGTILSSQLSS